MRMEKVRKTVAEVDGQFKCGLEGEGAVGRGDAKLGCVEASGQKNRPPHRRGEYAVEEEEVEEEEEEDIRTTRLRTLLTWSENGTINGVLFSVQP